ncbi:MAG: ADP-forming succinate--CoA ligase subunit beta [Spirochaetales bacterium]|nr:ADP-forming succinate--CoA ligase subunit beta [Spirochaetales bacterium]
MKIHEYQAKQLLAQYSVPVAPGKVCTTPEEVRLSASEFCGGGNKCVVKAQIHSGGRGKAGGVKLAASPQQAFEIATSMLGSTLYTHQTGPEGRVVHKVLVTTAVSVRREFYLSITADNENAALVIVASADGGTEIEETAKTHPERIVQIPLSPVMGFKRYQAIRTARALGLAGPLEKELTSILSALSRLYVDKDCSLVEINPLVETDEGHLLCLDAKVNFDDNALFRHPEIVALRDVDEEDPREYRASQSDLSYVSLDGDIGCLVNGAGLAMATMDIIKGFGGAPANFLDVGGSATAEKVKAAFEIILSDTRVKAIFVNIFGGIMKCDIIAAGVVSAASELGLNVPLVVRLEGTNVDEGRRILSESGLNVIEASDMADGARKAVRAAKEARA